ncbi:hypothetical protein GCM10023231_37200 [Olivibacter ginsenosidimutans]|uniref:Glycoside hydrolase family 2 n=1 Tax=Olivibacter ginsenosidimutans TaxID=1176537 RepID=A0ABP9C8W1_9SPHI
MMNRRSFLEKSTLLSASTLLFRAYPSLAQPQADAAYRLFQSPPLFYHPYVRWWWNGDKIEKTELARELRLLKEAEIGGVEINPIKFPQRTDDMGIPSLQWLSNEWIDLLDFTLKEAHQLGLTCDLIVGSGWPFGAEYLEGEEIAQVVTLAVKKVEGAMTFEAPLFDFLKEADPAVTSPFAHRKLEVFRVCLVPEGMHSLEQVVDLSDQIPSGFIKTEIPKGKYALYALVKTHAFLEVINGAPGANGQVLNHFNKAAVAKYLNHMTDTIQQRIGPLKGRVRALFTDSMELEGANWCMDMAEEFQKRRGYDLMPYLPFILFKIGGMGNVFDYAYGVTFEANFQHTVDRVRFDFDLTKTELMRERFIETFQEWCKRNGMKSRVQSYGRGYHPLEGSLNMDIPEGETWIKYGVGQEMPENDYRIGRGYTMVNKFVSSAAHLQGKRWISCEECTNTDMVFNATLQMIKLCSDQSFISGITHSIYHGFNYSPPQAPFPGWIRYGNFMNERNTYWPWFKLLNTYKGRISALLQQVDMFADIAILPPIYDMWTKYGAQNEPFPSLTYPTYLSLIWEAMNQHGNACDYVSDHIIDQATMKDGYMQYGPRKYHSLFLVQVESLSPQTVQQLLRFVQAGGRIFCIETEPHQSLGLTDAQANNQVVQQTMSEIKKHTNQYIFQKKPEANFGEWYQRLQADYQLTPYVDLVGGNPFVTQVRYHNDSMEVLFLINSSYENSYNISFTPHPEIYQQKKGYYWDATTGMVYRLENDRQINLTLAPADLRIFVYEKNGRHKAPLFQELPPATSDKLAFNGSWQLTFQGIDGKTQDIVLEQPTDLKDLPDFISFAGTVHYRNTFTVNDYRPSYIDLGKVYGISQVFVNGKDAGVRWYGRHAYTINSLLTKGENQLEIRVITTMGNYMKSLQDNPVAQYWTNGKRVPQPNISMGLIGPVTLF